MFFLRSPCERIGFQISITLLNVQRQYAKGKKEKNEVEIVENLPVRNNQSGSPVPKHGPSRSVI